VPSSRFVDSTESPIFLPRMKKGADLSPGMLHTELAVAEGLVHIVVAIAPYFNLIWPTWDAP